MFKFLESYKEKIELKKGLDILIEEGSLHAPFLVLTFLSALMAILGLLMNNVTVLIGAMLVAPLLTPVISLSIGVGVGSIRLIWHALKSLVLGMVIVVTTAAVATKFLASDTPVEGFTANLTQGGLYLLVSLVGGAVAVYSWFKPNRNQIIPGVGIAVALVPPLAYLGNLLVTNGYKTLVDALQLILLNLVGIFIGGLVVFWLLMLVNREHGKELETEIDEKVE